MLVVTTPTGRIGRHLLARLVEVGEPVRAFARDRTRIAPGSLAKVDVVEGSMDDPAALARALDGAEAVFWCIPENFQVPDLRDYYLGYTKPLVEALAGSSVRRIVYVSGGGNEDFRDAGPISVAFEAQRLLEGTGLHLRALQCGMFMENMLHLIEPIKYRGMFAYPIAGDFKVPLCAASDIAGTAARLLRDRSWTGQGGVPVHGPVDMSFEEMARVMTDTLGRPVRFQELSGPEYKAMLVGHGQPEAFAQALVDMFRAMAGGLHAVNPRTPESTTPTTFEAWCRDTLKPAFG